MPRLSPRFSLGELEALVHSLPEVELLSPDEINSRIERISQLFAKE